MQRLRGRLRCLRRGVQEGDGLRAVERHLSFYRYFSLGGLDPLREEVRCLCEALSLQGTVVLSPEGVNGMLAGSSHAVASFRVFAIKHFGLTERDFKEASAPAGIFHRLLVKKKEELISVGREGIRPGMRTAPRVSPMELREWLREGRPLLLLDARNRYEVEVGTFAGALELGLDSSREFAGAAVARRAEWEERTIVTFCTGGIRCEKASVHLEEIGPREVYQLEGGILRYFEECGGEHFRGNCFVFDWRLAVDPQLRPVPRSDEPAREFGRHRLISID